MDPITPPAVCVACTRPLPAYDLPRAACVGCQQRCSEQLKWLPGCYRLLDPAPRRAGATGSRHGAPGSRPPVDLTIVDLTGRRGVLGVLTSWMRVWHEDGAGDLPEWPTVEHEQVTTACQWLRHRLDWACRSHEAAAEILREVGDAYRQVYGAATGERGERRVALGCPCGGRVPFTASTGGASCADCGAWYGRAELVGLTPAPRAGGVAA